MGPSEIPAPRKGYGPHAESLYVSDLEYDYAEALRLCEALLSKAEPKKRQIILTAAQSETIRDHLLRLCEDTFNECINPSSTCYVYALRAIAMKVFPMRITQLMSNDAEIESVVAIYMSELSKSHVDIDCYPMLNTLPAAVREILATTSNKREIMTRIAELFARRDVERLVDFRREYAYATLISAKKE